MAEARIRGFSIATKCATVDELIEKFRDRVDDDSILVNTVESRDVGTECAFAILLTDKKVAIAGMCIVRDVYADANNPFMRPGMRLGIIRLGPESEKVFAKLVAKRIPPRRMTAAFPVVALPPSVEPPRTKTLPLSAPKPPTVAPPRTKTQALQVVAQQRVSTPAKPVIVMPRSRNESPRRASKDVAASPALATSRTTTSPLGSRDPHPVPSVRVPAITEEPLARTPRATPFDLEGAVKTEETEAPLHDAGGSDVPATAKPAAAETRTPGSPYVLPANPFMNLSDANLEGFVDRQLFEAHAAPHASAAGTFEDLHNPDASDAISDPVTELPSPTLPTSPTLPLRPSALARHDENAVQHVGVQRSEPLPLPPPPAPPTLRAEPAVAVPHAATRLPTLSANDTTNGNLRAPRVSRRLRVQLLLAILLVPLIGGGAVVLYMHLMATPSAEVPTLAPVTTATIDEQRYARAMVEPAPPVPVGPVVEMPTGPQPIHAVLVRTSPIAAKVTVGGRSFGTTPTYVKIPANTPIELRIVRPGFKPVTYPLTSTKRTDRVFIRLQRARGKR